MRHVLGVIALAGGIALGACGGSESTGERAFGDLSEQDRAALRDYSAVARDWPTRFGELVQAEEAQDAAAMRRAADGLTDIADRAQDTVLDFDNAKARGDFEAHADGYADVASALDRYVAYYEDRNSPADPSLEAELGRDIDLAGRELARADRRVATRILDATPVEDRPEVRERLRETRQQFEEQASGATP